jgi:hypothetical protein
MLRKIKTVPITLDRERHLLYDVNALIDLGDALELNLLSKEGWEALVGKMEPDPENPGQERFAPGEQNFRKVRAIIWAGLRHEDETLTERQVGAMLDPLNLAEAVVAYQRAFTLQDVADETSNADQGPKANATAAN